MKTKIRFITDIIVTVIMIPYSIVWLFEISGNMKVLCPFTVFFVTALLFITDACRIKSEHFRNKAERIERKYKAVLILEVIWAVCSIPVTLFALLFAPPLLLSLLNVYAIIETASNLGIDKILLCVYGMLIVILEVSAFVNIYYILNDKNNVVKKRE